MAYQYDLSGQVVLVVGASSGMGKATALAAAEAGAQVVLAARNVTALEHIVASITQTRQSSFPVLQIRHSY